MATFAATCVAPELTGSRNPTGLIQALYRRAGVQSRHSVLLESSSDDEATAERFFEFVKGPEDRGPGTAKRMNRFEMEAPAIALTATARAIQEADIDPADITHLITVSCSGFSALGVDLSLIEHLGLSRSRRPDTCRLHGVPRCPERPARGRTALPRPTHTPLSRCAP